MAVDYYDRQIAICEKDKSRYFHCDVLIDFPRLLPFGQRCFQRARMHGMRNRDAFSRQPDLDRQLWKDKRV